MIPLKEIVTGASISIWSIGMYIFGIISAFFITVALAKNLSNRAWNMMLGWEVKWKKQYQCRDIFEIEGKKWYLDVLNGLRLEFTRVKDWEKEAGTVTTIKGETLSIAYVTWQHMKIHKLGTCRI